MSLELALQENTNALNTLIALFQNGIPSNAPAAKVVAKPEGKKVAEKVAEPEVGLDASAAEVKPVETHLANDKTATQAAETLKGSALAENKHSYDDVKKSIQKLAAAKSRAEVVDLLTEFGVAAGPELKPAQYDAFVARATEAAEA